MPCPDELTVKPHSPGIVQDPETIVYLVFSPEPFRDGKLHPADIGVKRLKKAELSVARNAHCARETIQQKVIDVIVGKRPELTCAGAMWATCSTLRTLMSTGQHNRIFCVFDDPITPDFLGHALIGFSKITKQNNYWGQKANCAATALATLCEAFESGGIVSLDDCFQ